MWNNSPYIFWWHFKDFSWFHWRPLFVDSGAQSSDLKMLRTPGVRQSLAETLERLDVDVGWSSNQGVAAPIHPVQDYQWWESMNWEYIQETESIGASSSSCALLIFFPRSPSIGEKMVPCTNFWWKDSGVCCVAIRGVFSVCSCLLPSAAVTASCSRWLLKGLSFRVLPASNSFDDDGRGAQWCSLMTSPRQRTVKQPLSTSRNLVEVPKRSKKGLTWIDHY